MTEPQRIQSKIRKGLMILNNMKTHGQAQEKPKNLPKFQINPESDLNKYKIINNDELMLSNADCHVKNLLTTLLEDINQEDKSNAAGNKLKFLRQTLAGGGPPPIIVPTFPIDENEDFKKESSKGVTQSFKKRKKIRHKTITTTINKLIKEEIDKKTENVFGDLLNSNKHMQSHTPTHAISTKKHLPNLRKVVEFQAYPEYQNFSTFTKPLKKSSKSIKTQKSLKKKKTAEQGKNMDDETDFFVKAKTGGVGKNFDRTSPLFRCFQEPEVFGETGSYTRRGTKKSRLSNHQDADRPSPDIVKIAGLTKDKIKQLNDIKHKLKKRVFISNELEEEGKEKKKGILKNEKQMTHRLDENNITINLNNQTITARSTFEERYRCLSKKGYVYDSLDDEEIDDEVEGFFYIHPKCLFILIFEGIIFFSSIYSMIVIPYRLAHDLGIECKMAMKKQYFLFFLEFFIDLANIFDIFITFFTGYFNFDEVLIVDLKEIAIRYATSWLFTDLVTALPFNTYFLLKSVNCKTAPPSYYNTGTKSVFYIFEMLRTLKIFKSFSNNKFCNYLGVTLNKINHFNQWNKIYRIIIFFIIVLHCISCLFIFFAQNDYPNWIIENDYGLSGFWPIYVTSIYYMISSLTTVGYGDITSINMYELSFNLILISFGVIIYSLGLSFVGNYITAKDELTVNYMKKCKVLEEIRITYKKMPYELYNKIARFLRYRLLYEKKNKNIIIECIPIGLRNDLIYEMYRPIIRNFIFFKNFDNMDFIVRVILCFRPMIAVKSDVLVKEGDYIEEIIFVKAGSLNLEIPVPIAEENNNGRTMTKNSLPFSRNGTELTLKDSLNPKSTIIFHLNGLNKTGSFMKQPASRNQTIYSYNNGIRTKIEEEIAEPNVQYVKILEIRKNEHFGDVLMFLDRRSPLCVRVKSKMAELFFLNKIDAVDISTSYPQIWRKISKKSLFNMEQIERLINKAIKVCQTAQEETKVQNEINNESQNEDESCELRSIPSSIGSSSSNSNPSEEGDDEEEEEEEEEEESFEKKNNSPMLAERDAKNNLASVIVEENEGNISETSVGVGEKKKKTQNIISIGKITERDRESEKNKIDNSLCDSISGSCNNLITEGTNTTRRMNIENKSLRSLSSKESTEERAYRAGMAQDSISSTPFKMSEINTEIYPNEIVLDQECFFDKCLKKNEHEIKSPLVCHPPLFNDNLSNIEGRIYPLIESKRTSSNTFILKTEPINSGVGPNKESKYEKICMMSNVVNIEIQGEYENLNSLSQNNLYSKNRLLQQKVKKLILGILDASDLSDESSANNSNNLLNRNILHPEIKNISKKRESIIRSKSIKTISSSVNSPRLAISPKRTNAFMSRRQSIMNFHLAKDNFNNGRQSPSTFKEPKKENSINTKNQPKKTDLLNLISQNIENNSMNLKNPDMFYSEYFQQVMQNQTKINNQRALYDRLLDAEKSIKEKINHSDAKQKSQKSLSSSSSSISERT